MKLLFKILFSIFIMVIHLAADNASIGDIENALSSKNFEYQKDASVEGGFRVDTEKQYKGWAMMQIFSPDNVSVIFGITAGTGGAAEKVAGRSAAKGVSRVVAKKGAEVAAKGGTTVGKNVFTVTPEGVVLPKGAKIPSEFVKNPYYKGSSYGIDNGRFLEKVRIDQATPPGFKGPNQSHFHLNNKGHIFDPNKWPWWY